ncbi:PTS sugar transporter subunit IIA [Protaetiibacter intestinalis]|uniref:Ascorbate-specific PTS system EIIA component n=1 Tax=Protaetiibacter intestinalis TaxID=2419774 RepID=A0A387BAY5_9MICO|nr:PTS sugar transporter subunit IIA [Protaetiibacter intestinalis]AYF98306.1 PTS sugar transporter subunit IIA [Protaetiibacter intestinalis]
MDRPTELPPLPDEGIVLAARARDWREAVETAGRALTASGATDAGYATDMIRMIEAHGPYVVVAPGLALAHARPGPAVRRDGLAIVTLAEPVEFGHPYNDPVRVVLALAGASSARHLQLVAEIANIFNDSDAVERLAEARDAAEVRGILGVPA